MLILTTEEGRHGDVIGFRRDPGKKRHICIFRGQKPPLGEEVTAKVIAEKEKCTIVEWVKFDGVACFYSEPGVFVAGVAVASIGMKDEKVRYGRDRVAARNVIKTLLGRPCPRPLSEAQHDRDLSLVKRVEEIESELRLHGVALVTKHWVSYADGFGDAEEDTVNDAGSYLTLPSTVKMFANTAAKEDLIASKEAMYALHAEWVEVLTALETHPAVFNAAGHLVKSAAGTTVTRDNVRLVVS